MAGIPFDSFSPAGGSSGTPVAVGQALTGMSSLVGSASGVIVSGNCKIKQLIGDNASSTSLWLMLFDSATLPANGTTPKAVQYVPYGISVAATEATTVFEPDWLAFSTDCFAAWSTTAGTLTVVGSGTGLEAKVVQV